MNDTSVHEPIGVDINGLNPEDRARVQEIGLWAWMDETAQNKKPPTQQVTQAPQQVTQMTLKPVSLEPSEPLRNITRHKQVCTVCEVTFYSKRSDATYCSKSCRQKACYRSSGRRECNTFTL